MVIWGRLFEYFEKHKVDGNGCYHDHSFTRTFCKEYGINFDELEPILDATGGYCDCLVLFNTGETVDHNSEIPLLKYKTKERLNL